MSQESVIITGDKVQISSFGLIGEAWQIFKANWTKILGFLFVAFLVQMLAQASVNVATELDESGLLAFVFSLASMFFQAFLSAGLIYGMLKIARKQEFAISDLFSQSKLIFRYFFGTLAYGLLVMLGFVLLIIPGIYWAMKYWPMTYLLVDKDMKIGEAFGAAGKMTAGIKWQVFVFNLALVVVVILGLLALGVGLLVALPVMSIAATLLYVKLTARLEPVMAPRLEPAVMTPGLEPKAQV